MKISSHFYIVVAFSTAILKDADLASTSAKKVRQELEEKLDVKLQSRKKEIDDLVMEFVSSKKDTGSKKKGKKEESEEEAAEEDEEEEEEEEEVCYILIISSSLMILILKIVPSFKR